MYIVLVAHAWTRCRYLYSIYLYIHTYLYIYLAYSQELTFSQSQWHFKPSYSLLMFPQPLSQQPTLPAQQPSICNKGCLDMQHIHISLRVVVSQIGLPFLDRLPFQLRVVSRCTSFSAHCRVSTVSCCSWKFKKK